MFNKIKIDCLNFILKNNQHAQSQLAQLSSHTFNINVLGMCVSAQINKDGSLAYYDELKPHDVEILTPLKASSYLIHKDNFTIFKHLNIYGDYKLGREVVEILAQINLDNLYPRSPFLSVILLQVEKIITLFKDQMILLSKNSAQSISEYLLYETNDLVSKYELDNFCNAVDILKEQTELIEQKINRLMNK